MVSLCLIKEVLEILVMRGGVGEGALKDVCCVWCEACVAGESKHGFDHKGGLLSQLVSFGIDSRESLGEGFLARVCGGGAIIIKGFKYCGVFLSWLAEGVEKGSSTFAGEFAVLQKFEVRVQGDVETL